MPINYGERKKHSTLAEQREWIKQHFDEVKDLPTREVFRMMRNKKFFGKTTYFTDTKVGTILEEMRASNGDKS